MPNEAKINQIADTRQIYFDKMGRAPKRLIIGVEAVRLCDVPSLAALAEILTARTGVAVVVELVPKTERNFDPHHAIWTDYSWAEIIGRHVAINNAIAECN